MESSQDKQNPSSQSNSTLTTSNGQSKVLQKFGSANATMYKYISSKPYHRNTHFEDLHGLSINKSGDCDLIQANTKLIAVALSGPGGRVGIISTEKPGRLPTQIPSVLCGSEVTNFKFDPFNDLRLVTVSNDNKIRVWDIPEGGLEEDMVEPTFLFGAGSMDKAHSLEFHPVTKDVLMTVSEDFGNHTIRIWNVQEQKEEITISNLHKNNILTCVWSPDGTHIATATKEKKIRVLNARTGEVVSEGASHNSLRPCRLLWLGAETDLLVSTGFGLGSCREILLFNKNDLSKPVAKQTIDVSSSLMSTYFDVDCSILFVAGKGDRTIHTYHVIGHKENDEQQLQLIPLVKIEAATLQQGFAFLPKSVCNVKEIEIDKFYRLTPNSIELVGVRVPRARPEFFQDDIYVPTLDIDHPAQEAANWFQGQDKQLERIDLKPDDMKLLSEAPPPPNQASSKAKFEMGKKFVSDEQRKKEQMERMFAQAKSIDDKKAESTVVTNPEDEEVAEDEWDE